MSVRFTAHHREFEGVLHVWNADKQADEPKSVALKPRQKVLIPHLAFLRATCDGDAIRIDGTNTEMEIRVEASIIERIDPYTRRRLPKREGGVCEGHIVINNHELVDQSVRIKTQKKALIGTIAWNGDWL